MTPHFWLIAPAVFLLWAAVSFPFASWLGGHLRRNKEAHIFSPEEWDALLKTINEYEGNA